MINKKAQATIFIKLFCIGFCIVFCLIIIAFVIGMIYESWKTIGKECEYYMTLTLQSINGMKDTNTGFLSGGTVNQKNLLFDNGLVLTFGYWELNNIQLRIGKEYEVDKCVNNGGTISYKLK